MFASFASVALNFVSHILLYTAESKSLIFITRPVFKKRFKKKIFEPFLVFECLNNENTKINTSVVWISDSRTVSNCQAPWFRSCIGHFVVFSTREQRRMLHHGLNRLEHFVPTWRLATSSPR